MTARTPGPARDDGWRPYVGYYREGHDEEPARLPLADRGLAATAIPAAPALADGAASTRNIILGGAAATLLIINHNRKVHQKYAEYDRRQAQTQAAASNAEAAYESERSAYAHEAALVQGYQHEVAVQHRTVVELRRQLALAQHRGARPSTSPPPRRGRRSARSSPPPGSGTRPRRPASSPAPPRTAGARSKRWRSRVLAASRSRSRSRRRCAEKADDPQALADQTTRAVYDVDLDRTTARFDDALKAQVTRASIGDLSDKMHALGAYRGLKPLTSDPDKGRYDYQAAFDKGTMRVELRMDPDQKIGAYRVVPQPSS